MTHATNDLFVGLGGIRLSVKLKK